ncbi:MAG: 3-hydroxyacyl-CoA dehydrogenase family protein [Deltaproteobacteria bacterium]|nr:3-hydroxyacyl-CoA dehydrogenase family protein [Deltaproteobacteria bacterium]
MRPIERALVVGAGTMGHGIAQVLAAAGIEVTLVDVAQDLVDRGLQRIKANLESGVAKGKVTAAAKDATLAKLCGSTDLPLALSSADLLVEAIPEDMQKKRELFSLADTKMHVGALLASNTSSLSITEIASATKRPEHVVGLHFFNPVHLMKLLEIVRGALTAAAVVEAARALAARLGKTCIVVNDSPGFATSRLGLAVGLEATRMLEEGVASAADIDTAMKLGYGYPMGPLALGDLVGLDVRLAIAEAMHEQLGTDTFRPPRLLRKLVRLGHLGKKSGRGFFLYDDKGEIVGDNPVARPPGAHA